jgi:hypothetical protein
MQNGLVLLFFLSCIKTKKKKKNTITQHPDPQPTSRILALDGNNSFTEGRIFLLCK